MSGTTPQKRREQTIELQKKVLDAIASGNASEEQIKFMRKFNAQILVSNLELLAEDILLSVKTLKDDADGTQLTRLQEIMLDAVKRAVADIEQAGDNDRPLLDVPSIEQIEEGIAKANAGILLPYPVESTPTKVNTCQKGLTIPCGAISIIAGATNHGKTAMLVDMAYRMATSDREPKRILYLTNEGTRYQIHDRLHKRHDTDIQGMHADLIATKKIIVNECHDYSDKALTRSLRSIIGREPIDVVIVDWLQMIESEPAKFEKGKAEWYRLRSVMQSMNEIAIDNPKVAILTACQFNREVIHTGRMACQKIGDAIGISQLASKVIGIWNGKFNQTIAKNEREADGYIEGSGGVYLTVLKERHGHSLNPTTLTFDPRRSMVGGDSGSDKVDTGQADSIEQDKGGERTWRE